MSLVEHAKKELALLQDSVVEDDKAQEQINENILELVETLAKQGHSGFSAVYVTHLFERLVEYKPLTPLSGEEDEWMDVSEHMEDGTIVEQNIRCTSVFRHDNDNSTAYDISGRIFSDDGGETWFSGQGSAVPVSFPYAPPEEAEKVILEDKDEHDYEG